jgi:hypothetical protein
MKLNQPFVKTKEGQFIIDKSKNEIVDCFNYVIYEEHTENEIINYLKHNQYDIMLHPLKDNFLKYNVTDTSDQNRISDFVHNSLQHYVNLLATYKGDSSQRQKRSLIENYYFIDF